MSDLLSYLFTGLPTNASEQSKRVRAFFGFAGPAVMVMVLVLATLPSWPLAVGVAAGCGALAYVAKLVLASSAGNGP